MARPNSAVEEVEDFVGDDRERRRSGDGGGGDTVAAFRFSGDERDVFRADKSGVAIKLNELPRAN